MGPLNNASVFLISTLFNLYLFILAARLILAYARADYFNPLIQSIIRVTQPLVGPVRRLLPTIRGIEFSTLAWIIVIEMIKFLLLGIIQFGMPNVLGLLILGVADTLRLIVNTFFYGIFLQVILSWIQPPGYSPVGDALLRLTAPIMMPLRRIIPPVGGFDITPIPALILLQLTLILVVSPFLMYGVTIAFG